jgi:hypothetical protein
METSLPAAIVISSSPFFEAACTAIDHIWTEPTATRATRTLVPYSFMRLVLTVIIVVYLAGMMRRTVNDNR